MQLAPAGMTVKEQAGPIKEGGGGAGRDRHKRFPVVLNSSGQGSAIPTKLPALRAQGGGGQTLTTLRRRCILVTLNKDRDFLWGVPCCLNAKKNTKKWRVNAGTFGPFYAYFAKRI